MKKKIHKKTLELIEPLAWWEAMAEGILWIDDTGWIIHASDGLLTRLGWEDGLPDSFSLYDLEVQLGKSKFSLWWNALNSKENVQRESAFRREGTGDALPVQIRARRLPGDSRVAILQIDFLPFSSRLVELMRLSSRVAQTAAWHWELIGGAFMVTDEFYRMLELEREDKGEEKENIVQLMKTRLTLEQVKRLVEAIRNINENREPFEEVFEVEWGEVCKRLRFYAEPQMEDGRVQALRGCLQDLGRTDAKLPKKSLAQIVIDHSDELILWVEPDCSLRYANESVVRALGYAEQVLLEEKTILDIDVEHSQNQWETYWSELSEAESKVLRLESSFIRKNDTVFPVEMNITYLQIQDDILISLTARDISTRRKKEAQLKRALIEVESLSRRLEAENRYMKEELSGEYTFDNILTQSDRYRDVLHKVRQVATAEATVLITGETGTGKELLARAVHALSSRNGKPLIKVDCATLPKELIESELFGHEKGAFTGALKTRVGRFEVADGSTIFLDEIGELPLPLQAKLLRVIQEGAFERLGSSKVRTVDVRIVAATNRDLEAMVGKGEFRADLFYRLNVFPIHNLPLRERKEDIPLLVDHFVKRFAEKNRKAIKGVSKEDLRRLKAYDFPGNIRELENIIERSVIISSGPELALDHWQPAPPSAPQGEREPFEEFDEMQRNYIIRALKRTRWKVSGPGGAAELLGLNPQTLYSKMRKFGISRTPQADD